MQSRSITCEVLGVTGNAATGKDYLSDRLAEHGFVAVSTSDILREIIVSRGQMPSRELQTQVANELRAIRGGDYFVIAALARALEMYTPGLHRGIVLGGLYAPDEGIAVKKLARGMLVEVVQSTSDSPEARFERLTGRGDGSRDEVSYPEFLAAFQRENSGSTGCEANVGKLAEIADYRIVNDGNDEYLRRQIESLLGE